MSISKKDIDKAERENVAINKALQKEKVKNEKEKFTSPTKEQLELVEASKRVDYKGFL